MVSPEDLAHAKIEKRSGCKLREFLWKQPPVVCNPNMHAF